MAATAGKKAVLKVATASAGPYTNVANIKTASITINAALLDVTALAAGDWTTKIQGIRDAKVSASGNYDAADTTGQMAIRSSQLNDTPLWIQLLPDAIAGYQLQVRVASFAPSVSVAGESTVSIELEQTGGITLV